MRMDLWYKNTTKPGNLIRKKSIHTELKDWENLIPSATDFDTIDRFIKVTDEDSAHTTRELAKKEGLFVGYTSGAAMQGIKQFSEEGVFDENSVVVVIFPDHGSRYMSKVFSDEWMQQQGFMDTEKESQPSVQYIK